MCNNLRILFVQDEVSNNKYEIASFCCFIPYSLYTRNVAYEPDEKIIIVDPISFAL